MYFELLNTIKFLAYALIVGAIFWQLKSREIVKVSWEVYWVLLLIATLVTYPQFFTLTEERDVIQTQNVMEEQSSMVINGKLIQSYLDANKPTGLSKEDLYEQELEKQSNKSKQLAKEIEAKHNKVGK